MSELRTHIEEWAAAPDISARSTLVTIIGDTLVPIGSSLWMSQMLRLSEVFGFSDRLVRTSMNRLVSEDWLFTERVGRQSRYHLTDLAFTESARAAERIYGVQHPDWSGEWVLVFLSTSPRPTDRNRLIEHLRWNGYVPVAADVLAAPGGKPESARELVSLVDPDLVPVIATATFTELATLVEEGFFLAASDGHDLAAAYSSFLERYRPLLNVVANATPVEAFGIRTMLVHDLRRIRLRWPDLPVQARPGGWPGDAATDVASELYELAVATSSDWLTEVFGLTYPRVFPTRFSTSHDQPTPWGLEDKQ